MLWDPAACPCILQLIAFAESSVPRGHQFRLPKIPGLRRSVKTPDGSRHLLCQYANHFLQVHICGSWPSGSIHLLTDAVVAPHALKPRLRALELFNHLWHAGTVPGRFASAAANVDRLRFVLRALDGSLAGASYREIAVVLIGADRVQANWRDDNDHLKSRVRRAVRRGRTLMNKGYLRLLAEHWYSKEVGSRLCR